MCKHCTTTTAPVFQPWDLKTRNNQEIAPGVYFFRFEADGEEKTTSLW
jgi:hypothetical protein